MASKTASASLRAAFSHVRRPTTSSQTNPFARSISTLPIKRASPTILSKTTTRIRPSFATTLKRHAHSIPRPSETPSTAAAPKQPNTPKQPHYELTFTCTPCGTRSAHNVSKQGYHHGTVLISCPSCRNRHLIADHLNIFGNGKVTIEELMRERGQLVKRGTLGEDGDLEFWEDGSTTNRSERQGEGEGQDPKPPVPNKARADEASAADALPGASWGKKA